MADSSVVMLVSFRVLPEEDGAFNRWYETEHLPQLLSIVGFRSARRLARCGDPHHYLTIYEVENERVFETEAYLAWKSSPIASPPNDQWVLEFHRATYTAVGAASKEDK